MTRLSRIAAKESIVNGVDSMPKAVYLSFDTKYRGTWECLWTYDGLEEYDIEPSFYELTEEEQQEIHEIGPFIYYLSFGEIPEGSSIFDT
jgi:hypothetical protein